MLLIFFKLEFAFDDVKQILVVCVYICSLFLYKPLHTSTARKNINMPYKLSQSELTIILEAIVVGLIL